MGIRAAARQAAANLPPDEQNRFVKRVLKRAEREGWEKAKQTALTLATPQGLPLSSPVVNGADSMLQVLVEDSKATRIGFSKAARKVAEKLPELSESALMDRDTAQAAKHWQRVAAAAQPGWEQEKKNEGGLVSIALIGLHLSTDQPVPKVVQAIDV
jgi:hypothetical protein